MADAIVRLGYLTGAQFTANPTLVLEHGQHVHLSDGADEFVDAYVIGDGTTQLSALEWKGLKGVLTVTGSSVDNTDPFNPVINAATAQTNHYFTITGSTETLATSNPAAASYFLNGLRCEIGGAAPYDIASIVGTLVTFNEDRTGDRFLAIY